MVSSIEAPLTLLQKPMKILFLDSVEASQMTFGLVPKILNSIDMILLICEELRVVDAKVVKLTNIKSIV